MRPTRLLLLLPALLLPGLAQAFCGFYVGRAGASLYNHASQVVMVRDGARTVLTMSNDFKGDLTDFALVVPVPVVLEKEQIHVGERVLIDRVDAWSAPRLVEYFDPNPCDQRVYESMKMAGGARSLAAPRTRARKKDLGVTVKARYTVGEYDIVILDARQSAGLETWLVRNGYNIPKGARKALKPYIAMGMQFFVAKVNLKEQAKTGFKTLRPIQMAFDAKAFMLPIRLGMINADGPQDLLIYLITRKGRVEVANYPTVKVPANMEIPVYIKKKGEFEPFYKALFATAWEREKRRAAFTEYFWDMGWCDPCAADPLRPEELRKLGVMWLDEGGERRPDGRIIRRRPGGGAVDAVLTRLHVRYDAEHFQEDLMFKETTDRQNYQARYVLQHPWRGEATCSAARSYRRQLKARMDKRAETLANLTGWPVADIRKKMDWSPTEGAGRGAPWWKKLWR